MTSIPRLNGVGCHWGVSSTGITGFGALVLTSTDQTSEADTETAADGNGYVVTEVTYNHRESCTLETWVSGSGASVTIASSSYPQPGDKVTITDTIATGFAGSDWIAGGASVRRSNTSMAKVSIPLHRFAKIT